MGTGAVRLDFALLVAERESVFVAEDDGLGHLFKRPALFLQHLVEADTVRVLLLLLHGVCSFAVAVAVAFHAVRGMYLHAERHLAKAGGVASARRGGSPTRSAAEGEGLHKRSAEAWGDSLRARGAELPLAAFRGGCCGAGTGPTGMGSGRRRHRLKRGKVLLPYNKANACL